MVKVKDIKYESLDADSVISFNHPMVKVKVYYDCNIYSKNIVSTTLW